MNALSYLRINPSTVRTSPNPGPQSVLDALAEMMKNEEYVRRVFAILRLIYIALLEEHLHELGRAYGRVYRKPSPRNIRRLLKIEKEGPIFFNPHSFYKFLKKELVEPFKELSENPVFENRSLRRQLSQLRTRTLTLFYVPQLVRSRSSANSASLYDAVLSLSRLDSWDLNGTLYYLRSTLIPSRTSYDLRLLENLLFVAYHRLELIKRADKRARLARDECEVLMRRVQRLGSMGSRSRRLIAGRMKRNWEDRCLSPSAFNQWAAMIAGLERYNMRALYRAIP